jgi:hypothetical protein
MNGMKFGRGVFTAAALTLMTMSIAAVRAQQPPAQQPPAQQPPGQGAPGQPAQPAGQQPPPATPGAGAQAQPAPPQKPLIPLSVGTLLKHPENYYNDTVTVTGPVEQIVSPLSFSLDSDSTKSTDEVLVLAPRLNEPPAKNAYVTIIAKMVKFDAAELAQQVTDRKIDVPADAAAKYAGKPALLASFIMTSGYVELTRKNPPPMTAADQLLSPIMKKLQPAVGAVRQAADQSDMPAVTQNALVLKQGFTEIESFFKKAGNVEATRLAGDARLEAEKLQRIVATGKWDEVKSQAGTVQQKCAACHGVYRERFDDGSYRLKAASK